MRKAQAALEFVILFSISLLALSSFVALVEVQTAYANEQNKLKDLVMIGNILEKEVLLANQVRSGYERTFTLPVTASGELYTIAIMQKEVVISTNSKEHILFLSVPLEADSSAGAGENTITKRNGKISIN